MGSERNPPKPATPTVLSWLLARYPGERREILQRFVDDGRVLIDGAPAVHIRQEIADGSKVELGAKRAREAKDTLAPLKLIHEDDELLIVDKPAALLTSTNAREKRPTALKLVDRHVRATDPRGRAWLIHRLDRDASGLLVFAKSKYAFESLKSQFYAHSIERQYLARVRGVPRPADGDIYIALIERADGTVRPAMEDERGEEAHTRYAVIASTGDDSWVRVRLHTGRKHQIRAHLAAIGHPLIGDVLYDTDVEGSNPPMLLRAMVLGLAHPKTEQWLRFVASLPAGIDPAVAAKFAPQRE
jgi:23S rRNA pseudouridine1911/1915/1917 synthase